MEGFIFFLFLDYVVDYNRGRIVYRGLFFYSVMVGMWRFNFIFRVGYFIFLGFFRWERRVISFIKILFVCVFFFF